MSVDGVIALFDLHPYVILYTDGFEYTSKDTYAATNS